MEDKRNFSIQDSLVAYALSEHKADLFAILKSADENKHYSITLNFVGLFESSTELGDAILCSPTRSLPICDQSLLVAQQYLLDSYGGEDLILKRNVHTRITALPVCPELHKSAFPRNEDIGCFLRVTGTVVRRTASKMLEYGKEYICSKCKHAFIVLADYELYYVINTPSSCKNPDGCNGTKFSAVDSCLYKDYQEIKLQEQVAKLDMGSMPRSMWVSLEDDLVETCKPGDDVVVCGTVRRRWKSLSIGGKTEIDLFIQANHVEVSNDQNSAVHVTPELREEFVSFWNKNSHRALEARNEIVSSICPDVYGLYIIKLAVALVLAGGVGQEPGSGARVRGESHLLLVGDPGTAKSQILRFAASLSPRSVFTTGIGSTSAGLTVSALMSSGEWQLEAGALVLADGGLCCIDEFNSIREHDRASIHEAMEQQTISVAKAGMVCKLSTRCTILAATNPKGNYDPSHPITVNCAIASPLLSRFDLVFVLLDNKNPQWDNLISSFILLGQCSPISTSSVWSLDKLQVYYSIIKTIIPKLSEEAMIILREYYHSQRRNDSLNTSRATVRLLESLIRLAQAHARFMFREYVIVQDAIVSVSLIESSIHGSYNLITFNAVQTTFPQNPAQEYINQAQEILGKLGLYDILEKEIQTLQKLDSINVLIHEKKKNHAIFTTNMNDLPPGINEKLDTVLNNIRQSKLEKEKAFIGDKNELKIMKNSIETPVAEVKNSVKNDMKSSHKKRTKQKKKKKATELDDSITCLDDLFSDCDKKDSSSSIYMENNKRQKINPFDDSGVINSVYCKSSLSSNKNTGLISERVNSLGSASTDVNTSNELVENNLEVDIMNSSDRVDSSSKRNEDMFNDINTSNNEKPSYTSVFTSPVNTDGKNPQQNNKLSNKTVSHFSKFSFTASKSKKIPTRDHSLAKENEIKICPSSQSVFSLSNNLDDQSYDIDF